MSHDIADSFQRGEFRLPLSLSELVRSGELVVDVVSLADMANHARDHINESIGAAGFRRVAVESLAWSTRLRHELRKDGWRSSEVLDARIALQHLIDDVASVAPSLAGEEAQAGQDLSAALAAAQAELAKASADNTELHSRNAELEAELVKVQQASRGVIVALERVADAPPNKPRPSDVRAVFNAARQMVEGDDQAVTGCNIVESICVRAKGKPYKLTEHRRCPSQMAREDVKNFINCIDAAKVARGEGGLNRSAPEFYAMDITRIVCSWLPVVDADTAASRQQTVKRVVGDELKCMGFVFPRGAPTAPNAGTKAANVRQGWLCGLADDGGFRKPIEKSQAA